MPKGALFSKVKAAEKPSKKNDKLNVLIKDEEFDQNLITFAQLTEQIDILTAELAVAKSYVLDYGKKTFNDVYKKSSGYPGSFIMSTPSESSVMFSPSDKYIKCDENRFNELKEAYGDDIVTEKTEFIIDPTLLEKYGDILGDFVENSPDIEDDDRLKLFKSSTTYSVSKGAIEKAFSLGKGEVEQFISDIQPVFSLRTPKAGDK